jgi:prepilin-type N-terminal cleavage/methylation domain-containing protein
VRIPTGRGSADDRHGDAGFTLIEMLITLAIGSVLMAIATWGMRAYLISNREANTARDVRSALRNAGEQALSEGRTYCVYFTATTWTVYRSDCTVPANKTSGPFQVEDSSITLTSLSFPAPGSPVAGQNTACPQSGKCAYFYPRGTALAGTLRVTRPGKTYTLTLEGLTARVSLA